MAKHEVHHGYMRRQNELTGRNYGPQYRQFFHIAKPCGKYFPDLTGCDELLKIFRDGAKQAEKLLELMSKDKTLLSEAEGSLVTKYESLVKGYKPNRHKSPMPPDEIESMLKAGTLDKNYKILTKDGKPAALPSTIIPGVNCFGVKIKKTSEEYLAVVQSVKDNHDPKAALLDLIAFDKLTDWAHTGTLVDEKDAYYHQLFEDYPDLMDFLFPGLKQYHDNRSSPLYHQCLHSRV